MIFWAGCQGIGGFEIPCELRSDDRRSISLDSDSSFEAHPNRLRQGEALLRKHAIGEASNIVVLVHLDDSLEHDRTSVVLVAHEVDRAARLSRPALEHCPMDTIAVEAPASERREKGRVNVEDSSFPAIGDAKEAQETREDDPVDFGPLERGDDPARKRRFIDLAKVDRLDGNSCGLGFRDATGVAMARDGDRDVRGQRSVGAAPSEVLESAPTARKEDAEARAGGWFRVGL